MTRKHSTYRSKIRRDLRLERLEDRQLLTAAPSAEPAEWVIEGTEGDDVIRVYTDFDFMKYDLNGVTHLGPLVSDTDHIVVKAKGGNDFVEIDDSVPQTTELYGGTGDDFIVAGLQADTVVGGWGNDTLHGGPGPDTMVGFAGNDTMHGDDGDDTIYGDAPPLSVAQQLAARDPRMAGDPGQDTTAVDLDNDDLFAGRDRLFGEAGDDYLHGGPGRDLFHGGDGSDNIWAKDGYVDDLIRSRGDDTYHIDWFDRFAPWALNGGLKPNAVSRAARQAVFAKPTYFAVRHSLPEREDISRQTVVRNAWGDFPEIEEIDPDDLEWPVR